MFNPIIAILPILILMMMQGPNRRLGRLSTRCVLPLELKTPTPEPPEYPIPRTQRRRNGFLGYFIDEWEDSKNQLDGGGGP